MLHGDAMGEVKGEGQTDIDLTNLDSLDSLPAAFTDEDLVVDRTKVKEKVDDGVVTPRTIQKYTGRLYPCKTCGKEKIKEPRSGRIPEYCNDCLHDMRLITLKKRRLAKTREIAFKGTLEYTMPDGFIATLQSEEEETFVDRRVHQYIKDFEWKESADLSVLSRLILMELQCNRIMKLLTLKYRGADAKVLGELSEEVRKCQELLGIDRVSRENDKSGENPYDIVHKMVTKFADYRERHPERFMWRCKHCDKINSIGIENPDVPKIDLPGEISAVIQPPTENVPQPIEIIQPAPGSVDIQESGDTKQEDPEEPEAEDSGEIEVHK